MTAVLETPFPPQPQRDFRLETPMVRVEPRWEYREVVREAEALLSEADLDALGAEHWELAGVAPVGGKVHFYFKRERAV